MHAKFALVAGLAALSVGAAWIPAQASPGC